ncbi:hypothetical protein HMI54_010936 [Coelomomyces lativittatus]|nr:hypothetical protein HMI54_010936 [Coelomomyces lativittatus]
MHDSERGTRMKIDEPRTPYMYYDSSADDLEGGVKAEDLSDALDMTTRDSSPNSSHPSDSWTDSETDNEPESPIKSDRKRRFHQLRSQHYDMKEVLAKARWQKSTSLEGGEVDEDEVDEDDDENKEKKKLENENENENKKKEKKLFKNPSPRDTLSFEDSKDSGDFSEYESYSSISSLTPPKKFSKN